jgi:hypothetical protein
VLVAGGGQGAIELVRQLLLEKMPAAGIYCPSIIGTELLLRTVGSLGNGIVVTQVMPSLKDRRFPVGSHYVDVLRHIPGAEPALIGLEAFLSMQIALRGLARSTTAGGVAPSGVALSAALERLGTLDIGGFRVQYDRRNHHGTRFVDIGITLDGRIVR